MKKQIIILLLSAGIFTISPLFAMEEQVEEQEKGLRLNYLAYKREGEEKETRRKLISTLVYAADSVKMAGKGFFHLLDKNVIFYCIIKRLSYQELIRFSSISKEMYNLCQSPIIWRDLLIKNYPEYHFIPGVYFKEQFKGQKRKEIWVHNFRLAR